jgi:hypothetical protein
VGAHDRMKDSRINSMVIFFMGDSSFENAEANGQDIYSIDTTLFFAVKV